MSVHSKNVNKNLRVGGAISCDQRLKLAIAAIGLSPHANFDWQRGKLEIGAARFLTFLLLLLLLPCIPHTSCSRYSCRRATLHSRKAGLQVHSFPGFCAVRSFTTSSEVQFKSHPLSHSNPLLRPDTPTDLPLDTAAPSV